MKCLFCGREISGKDPEELTTQWHKHCIKKFFGTMQMPELDISDEALKQLADESVNHGFTVPGVQKKLSIHLSKAEINRLTLVGYSAGYILKPRSDEFQALPEAEDLCMRMAERAGLSVAEHALLKMPVRDKDEIKRMESNQASTQETNKRGKTIFAYITKRMDRDENLMYAMEDFCQLNYRVTADKYKGSYEKCAKTIERYSEMPGLDLSELYLRLLFCFVTGNSDMHYKNFSLIEQTPGSRKFVLSKAYDLLPVNVIIPEDKEEMALTLNGKKKNIRKKDFLQFAKSSGIPAKSAEKMLLQILKLEPVFFTMCDESYMPTEMKEVMKDLMAKRYEILH